MPITKKQAPQITSIDPNVQRAIRGVYNDINDIIDSVNSEVSETKAESKGKKGDIRVVKDQTTQTYKLEAKTSDGWAGIALTLADDNKLNFTATGGLTLASLSNVSVSCTGGIDITTTGTSGYEDIDIFSSGRVILKSTENAAASILIMTDGGDDETIMLYSDQGTRDDSIVLKSDEGGITMSVGAGKDVDINTGNLGMVDGTLDVQNGGAATQAVGGGFRESVVTVNFYAGKVTTDDGALTPATTSKHLVLNDLVDDNDIIVVSKVSGAADTSVWVDAVGAGSFVVALRNNAASGDDTTALVYNFVVIKGSNS